MVDDRCPDPPGLYDRARQQPAAWQNGFLVAQRTAAFGTPFRKWRIAWPHDSLESRRPRRHAKGIHPWPHARNEGRTVRKQATEKPGGLDVARIKAGVARRLV